MNYEENLIFILSKTPNDTATFRNCIYSKKNNNYGCRAHPDQGYHVHGGGGGDCRRQRYGRLFWGKVISIVTSTRD